MQNLSTLHVEKCNELEYLSSVDVAKSLVKLQEVKIEECRSLELIFLVTKKQGGEEDGTLLSEKLSLPQLQTLHLSDLPNLKMLCATVDKKNAQLDKQEPLFNGMVGPFLFLPLPRFLFRTTFFRFFFFYLSSTYLYPAFLFNSLVYKFQVFLNETLGK